MLVQEWMTKEVVTITADISIMKAARLMKDKRVGRLPVVDEDGRIVGILTDRDIRSASPSKATTLEMHELYYLLSELKTKDVMNKTPICARETDSVEGIARLMMAKRIGGDIVGMSTALEAIAAREAGMEILGFSLITNLAAGIQETPLSHAEVIEAGREAEPVISALLARVIEAL